MSRLGLSLFHSPSGVIVVKRSPDCRHQSALMGAHLSATPLIELCQAHLPSWVIGGLLWVSETPHRSTHDGVKLTHPSGVLPMDAIFWRDRYAIDRR